MLLGYKRSTSSPRQLIPVYAAVSYGHSHVNPQSFESIDYVDIHLTIHVQS